MARVCPNCICLTAADEMICQRCGASTVTSEQWLQIRGRTQPSSAVPVKEQVPEQTPEEVEQWANFGMGGFLAAFLFFAVFMIVYLGKAL